METHKAIRSQAKTNSTAGFTLVEVIVAAGLFAVVMLVSVSTLLALVNANRKAQALQSVMNNLNISLDAMVRSIRMGSDYNCQGGGDCFSGGSYGIGFTSYDDKQIIYFYNPEQQRIFRKIDAGIPHPITAPKPEVIINSMKFYVRGTTRGDSVQPEVIITINGTAGASDAKTSTEFNIQATAVQRILDL